jgi:small subunit ribosomal protein S9
MPKTSTKKQEFIAGTGRRKTAIATIFLYQEKGEFTINEKPISEYFPTEKETLRWARPFHLIGVSHPVSQFRGTIKLSGSSKPSQLGALALAISRALAEISEENQVILAKQGFLTRDSRMVERKKYFLRKARKAPQYSKR